MVVNQQLNNQIQKVKQFNQILAMIGFICGGLSPLFLLIVGVETSIAFGSGQPFGGFVSGPNRLWWALLILISLSSFITTIFLSVGAITLVKIRWSLVGVGSTLKTVILSVSSATTIIVLGLVGLYGILTFDTEYTPAYTESGFDSIISGMSLTRVEQILGPPFEIYETKPYQLWVYSDQPQPDFTTDGSVYGTYTIIRFDETSLATTSYGQVWVKGHQIFENDGGGGYLNLPNDKVVVGQSQADIIAAYGEPTEIYTFNATKILVYTRSPSNANYFQRQVLIGGDEAVVKTRQDIYWD